MIALALAYLASINNAFVVSATAVASPTESPRTCITRALDAARAKAMDSAPREIRTSFIDVQIAHGGRESQFVHDYATILQSALMTTEKVEEKPIKIEKDGTTRCEVTLQGRFLSTGAPDPSFQIRDVFINQPSFFPDQEAEIRFKVTADAYVYVLAVDEAQKVSLVFPNSLTTARGNYVKAGTLWTFPSDDDRRQGITVRAALPEGRTESVELLQVIAVKDEPVLFGRESTKRKLGPYELLTLGDMNVVVAHLAGLERRTWTTATTAYTIRSR